MRGDLYKLTLTNPEGTVIENWLLSDGPSDDEHAYNITKAFAGLQLLEEISFSVSRTER